MVLGISIMWFDIPISPHQKNPELKNVRERRKGHKIYLYKEYCLQAVWKTERPQNIGTCIKSTVCKQSERDNSTHCDKVVFLPDNVLTLISNCDENTKNFVETKPPPPSKKSWQFRNPECSSNETWITRTLLQNLYRYRTEKSIVGDPKLFIPDPALNFPSSGSVFIPDPALNFPSSGSGSNLY